MNMGLNESLYCKHIHTVLLVQLETVPKNICIFSCLYIPAVSKVYTFYDILIYNDIKKVASNNVANWYSIYCILLMYIFSKHSHKTNGAMKNEWEQVVACDPFNILLKTTKQVLVMFLNGDQCTSFFHSQSILTILDPEKMSWFEIKWSIGHVGLDMSNGYGGLNCGGCNFKYL